VLITTEADNGFFFSGRDVAFNLAFPNRYLLALQGIPTMEPSLRLRWRVLKLKPTQLHTSFSESSRSSAKRGGSCRLRMRNRRTCEGKEETKFSLVGKRDVTLYRHSAAKAHSGKRLREAKRDVTSIGKNSLTYFYDV
jgi:hypothetical protein